jgi:16S rRNA (guanine527-N7)-methyltransferase
VDFEPLIRTGLAAANVEAGDETIVALGRYLGVLARWNRRINLTAFDLDAPTRHAIDRLIVEPLVAAGLVRADDRVAVDVGSGGGSPALPLKIAVPWLRMTLIEARVRKSAFLREAIRELGLTDVDVDTRRLGEGGLPALNSFADIVTLRAVKAGAELWRGISALTRPGGRVLWFSDSAGEDDVPAGFVERAPVVENVFLRVLAKD